MVNYQKMAFAGGIMLSKIVPSTNSITIYNANSVGIDLTGIEIYKGTGASACANFGTDTLAAGATKTITNCAIDADDAVRLHDHNPTNGGGEGDGEDGKLYVIDGVCWNDDGSTIDADCNQAGDFMIEAGVWTVGVAKDTSEGGGELLELKTLGNNDQGPNDWYVPEFSTILMPIASVLLIVGYGYRKKEAED